MITADAGRSILRTRMGVPNDAQTNSPIQQGAAHVSESPYHVFLVLGSMRRESRRMTQSTCAKLRYQSLRWE